LLFPLAMTFVVFKGTDYSLFSTVKELLYYGLNPRQKYGAKYIADILVYRFSKGIISVLLIVISSANFLNFFKLQSNMTLTTVLLFSFLIVWVFILKTLFKEREKLVNKI